MRILLIGLLIVTFFVCAISAQTNEAVKSDEFENASCDFYAGNMDSFLTQLNNNPTAKGYVFVYDGKVSKPVYDKNDKFIRNEYISSRSNDVIEHISYFKKQAEFRSFPTNRIVFIEAGLREKFTIQFWIVPSGANPPKSSPTLTKLRHRKAKSYYPYGFCGEE